MALGDFYRLDVSGVMLGQPFLNRYFYETAVGAGSAQDLIVGFITRVIPFWQNMAHDSAVIDTFKAVNQMDALDQFTAIASYAGVGIGDVNPTWVGWAYELVPTSGIIRNGRKTFCGVPEQWLVDGNLVASKQTDADLLAIALEAQFVGGGTDEYKPVMVSPPNNSHAFMLVSDVDSCEYKRCSSQNSRKSW